LYALHQGGQDLTKLLVWMKTRFFVNGVVRLGRSIKKSGTGLICFVFHAV
jgi:hypothetical protein